MIDNISWLAIYPEIVLLTMACVIALVDLGVHSARRTGTYVLTMLTLAVVAALQGMYATSGNTFYGFGNMVVSDAMGNWLKCFATVAMMVTLVYARPYATDRDMLRGGEMFTLAMFALLGMFIMISGNNFLVIYLGLELLTLSSYALVALRRDNATATEAAMKYFVLGAMASGFLLYGLSMIYGATGSLDIGQVFKAVNSGQIRHFFLVGGCDGARPGRNYYTEFVKQTPPDTIVLTLACGKFRFNDLDLGTVAGLPRILDIGQCNDAYSAIQIALALADAFGCGVNELPLSMVLSWYEQKAVCILLTLLYLGIKDIRLGPTLPAFLSPNVLDYLVKNFGIAPITTPEEDLKAILG